MVKNETKRYWTKRAKFYKNDIRGVLFKKPYPSFVNTLFHNWSVGQVQGVIKKNDHVLDIACGWGRVSKELLKVNKKISIRGVDISKPFAQIYNNELSPRAKAKVASMEKLPFKNSVFDKAFLIVSLMYLPDIAQQQKAISEIFRVLKQNGKVVLIERTPLMAKFDLGALLKRNKHIQISFTQRQIRALIDVVDGEILTEGYWPARLLPLYVCYTIRK